MARRDKGVHFNRLGNARDIEKLAPGRHPDGGGLYVQVTGESRSWVFRTRKSWIGLGATHTITPAEAREKARQCRAMQMDGTDPLAARRAKEAEARLAAMRAKTFREVAEEWLSLKAQTWKPATPGTPGTLDQIKPRFTKHIYPVIGDELIQRFDMRPKGNCAVGLVVKVVAPLWKAGKKVLATTLQQNIRGVLDLAIAQNYGDLFSSNNAASVRDGSPLALLLPKISQTYASISHAAFPWEDMGRLVAALRGYTWLKYRRGRCRICAHPERAAIEQASASGLGDYRIATRFGVSRDCVHNHRMRKHASTGLSCSQGPVLRGESGVEEVRPIAAYALEFIILTATRNGQACAARWDEVDARKALWTCEQHKTREVRTNRRGETVLTGEPHVIPLSDAAMAVLHAMRDWQNAEGIVSEYVFATGQKAGGQHLGHTSINVWLRGFKKKRPEFANVDFTPHGMRTAFKSWATSKGFPEVDSETALAHVIGTPVSRIYAKDTDTTPRRRVMMQKWADHRNRVAPTPDVVVPFRPISQVRSQ